MRQLVPLPGEEEVAETALPSQRFPSDHLSLCCDFEWLLPSSAHTTSDQQKSAAPGRYPGRLGSRKKLPQPSSPHLVYKGVTALGKGHVIALPTDTVYGLAAAADSAEGVARLYQVSLSVLWTKRVPLSVLGEEFLCLNRTWPVKARHAQALVRANL